LVPIWLVKPIYSSVLNMVFVIYYKICVVIIRILKSVKSLNDIEIQKIYLDMSCQQR